MEDRELFAQADATWTFARLESANGTQPPGGSSPLETWYRRIRTAPIRDMELSDLCRAVRQRLYLPVGCTRGSAALRGGSLGGRGVRRRTPRFVLAVARRVLQRLARNGAASCRAWRARDKDCGERAPDGDAEVCEAATSNMSSHRAPPRPQRATRRTQWPEIRHPASPVRVMVIGATTAEKACPSWHT